MHPSKFSQQGFSLVEIMIASTLGIVLSGAAIQFLLSSNETYALNDDLSRAQENGRMAMDILAKDIRMAAYQDDPIGVIPNVVLTKCTHDNGNEMPCAQDAADASTSDRLSLQFVVTDYTNLDCLGADLSALDGMEVANVYTITEADNIRTLNCSSFNVTDGVEVSAIQPLVDGIDRLEVLYRVPNGGGTEYVSLDRVDDDMATEISAIRIGILVSNGLERGKVEPMTMSYQVLDGPSVQVANDTQLRRIFTSTVQLNNRHAGDTDD